MPSIKLSAPHQLGAEEARKRVAGLISDAQAQFGDRVSDVEESWSGNRNEFSFRAMGFKISGEVKVENDSVDVDMSLPFAALPFKSRIEREFEGKAKELLA